MTVPGYHSPQVSRRSVPLDKGPASSPLLLRHRHLTADTSNNNNNNISLGPGSPLRSSTSVLASLDKSILQIR